MGYEFVSLEICAILVSMCFVDVLYEEPLQVRLNTIRNESKIVVPRTNRIRQAIERRTSQVFACPVFIQYAQAGRSNRLVCQKLKIENEKNLRSTSFY